MIFLNVVVVVVVGEGWGANFRYFAEGCVFTENRFRRVGEGAKSGDVNSVSNEKMYEFEIIYPKGGAFASLAPPPPPCKLKLPHSTWREKVYFQRTSYFLFCSLSQYVCVGGVNS